MIFLMARLKVTEVSEKKFKSGSRISVDLRRQVITLPTSPDTVLRSNGGFIAKYLIFSEILFSVPLYSKFIILSSKVFKPSLFASRAPL